MGFLARRLQIPIVWIWPALVHCASFCGQPLAQFPGLNGVPVTALSNAPDQGTGTSCAGGPHYQCVEFVKRVYSSLVDTSKWTGNAIDYYSTANSKGLIAYPNGGSIPPENNDILVFDGDTYGHVAIVTAVTATTVSLVEQNWSPTGTASLTIQNTNGQYTISPRGTYTIVGWLRLPGQSVNVPTGASLQITIPYPDLAFFGGNLPNSIFQTLIGPPPSNPNSTYQFSVSLQSIDGAKTTVLPTITGSITQTCVGSFFSCTLTPAIVFTNHFVGNPGLGVLSPTGIPGQPGAKVVLTNLGPPVVIGGVFPDTTLTEQLAVTLGYGGFGVTLDALGVTLVGP